VAEGPRPARRRPGADAATPPRALADAFVFATDYLGVFIDEVNALNVYPVPDGDTGTNMHLTLQSVRRQLLDDAPTRWPTSRTRSPTARCSARAATRASSCRRS
jgi:hypothetical protein